MNQRPLTADGARVTLTEYLWQFTMFNNADFAVESSSTSTSGERAGADHPHGPAGPRRGGQLRQRADRRLDSHDERDRRRDHALADGNVRTFNVKSTRRRGELSAEWCRGGVSGVEVVSTRRSATSRQ